jgi:hypothetical protein
MKQIKPSITGQLMKFYEAAYFDLPFAAVERWMGGDKQKLATAGWAAYDSFVELANEMINQMYANPLVAASFGPTLEAAFRVRMIFDPFTFDAFTPSNPAALPAPVDEALVETTDMPAEATQRLEAASREAHHLETVAPYRTVKRARPRRAAA